MAEYYHEYLEKQAGGGGFQTGIDRVFIGHRNQQGHGIGRFLGGVLRRVLPLLTSGAKAVGKELFHTGVNVMSDVALRNVPVRDSVRTRVRESGDNLKRKAEEKLDNMLGGSAYKTRHRLTASHFNDILGRTSIARTKKKRSGGRKKRTKSTARKKRSTAGGRVTKKRKKKRTQKKKKKKSKKNVKLVKRDIFG